MKEHGTFIWNELITPDQETSGDFYSRLFGWERKEMDAGPFGTYTIFQHNGKDVAGMMNPTIDYTRKLGVRWYAYVAVEDIDAYAVRAKELGRYGHSRSRRYTGSRPSMPPGRPNRSARPYNAIGSGARVDRCGYRKSQL